MSENIKINALELENVKRIKAVKMEPSPNGLTVIGGKNGQGKTSVLDSIAWALGGDKFKPSNPVRDGSTIPPILKVTLSNGIIVERKGKNSTLKVTDPTGKKGTQSLLDGFIEKLALNLPKFMNSDNKEKAKTLLQIIGVEEELTKLELEETTLYNRRVEIGRIADQKTKFAKEQIFYEGVPKEPVSAKELIDQQQEILAKNGENTRKREKVHQYEFQVNNLTEEVARIEKQLEIKKAELNEAVTNLSIAKTDSMDLIDQSTEELEKNIEDIDEINRKVRANLDKEKAEEDAKTYADQYADLSTQIEEIRKKKMDLLKKADLPLPELTVENNCLKYKGQAWDNMSGSEQLRVATAIVRKLNPECGFVLLDKLEQMDTDTMNDFGKWLEQEGLQVIATRVSTGEECSIIIEDGYAIDSTYEETSETKEKEQKLWEAGKF